MSLGATARRIAMQWHAAALAALLGAARVGDATAQDPEPTLAAVALPSLAPTLRDSVVALARAQLGVRYRRGGATPSRGFDCSGFVQFVMSAIELDIPRTARLQARAGFLVPRDTSRLLPGDVLTFARTKKSVVSHVGIYVGDGRFVHASSAAGRVIESRVNRPITRRIKVWRGARRLPALDDDSSLVIPRSP